MLISLKKQAFNYNISNFVQREEIEKSSWVSHSQKLYWLNNTCTLALLPRYLALDEIKTLFITLFAVSVFIDTGNWRSLIKKTDVIKNRTMAIIRSWAGATINKRLALWCICTHFSSHAKLLSGAARETSQIISLKVLLLHWPNVSSPLHQCPKSLFSTSHPC